MQLTQEDPKSLLPNPWNTNEVSAQNMRKLEASLERHGWVKPVLARRIDKGLQILGGQHRVEAAVSLGHDTVPVLTLEDVEDDRAKEIGLIDNARYGSDDEISLAELLQDIGPISEIATFLPFSDDEIASLSTDIDMDLDDLDPEGEKDAEAPDDSKPEKAAKTHQILRFKVPIEDADDVVDFIDSIREAQGYTDQDSLSNAGDALVWMIANWGKEA